MDVVARWVISHVNSDGLRRLTFAQQGRYTYGSADSARIALRAHKDGLSRVLSTAELATLDVRAVACYPGHHDPVGYYLDKFTVQSGTILRDGLPFMSVQPEDLDDKRTINAAPVEIDALRHWICDRLNDPEFRFDDIVRAYRES